MPNLIMLMNKTYFSENMRKFKSNFLISIIRSSIEEKLAVGKIC